MTYTLKYLIFDHEIVVHLDAFLITFCKRYNLGACLTTPPRRIPAPSLWLWCWFPVFAAWFSGSAVARVWACVSLKFVRGCGCVYAYVYVEVLQSRSCHRLPPQSGIRFPTCKLPSRLRSRCPAMTESPATEPSGGDGGQRARNGLKPEGNGSLKSLRHKHELQSTHYCQPEEEEVRPGMGRERLGEHLLRGPGRCALFFGVFFNRWTSDELCHLPSNPSKYYWAAPNIIRNILIFEKKKSRF